MSSSSGPGLNRTRSLRQPTAGLGSVPKRIDAKRPLELKNKPALASSASSSATDSSRLMSPSKLPKPGASTTAARPGAGPSATGNGGTRSRPNSGIIAPNRSNTTAARQPLTQTSAGAGAEPQKRTRTLPAAGSRLTRPKSMVGPSQVPSSSASLHTPSATRPKSMVEPSSTSPTSLQSPSLSTAPAPTSRLQSPRTTAHTRAKSTATSSNPKTTLRPQRPSSLELKPPASKTAAIATAPSKRPLGRASTVTTREPKQQRQVSPSSAANSSVLSTASSTTTARPPRPKVTTEAQTRLKPAFNTLQQHYSPARNLAPKPTTASYLAPPTPSKLPANVALSTGTAKQQTELLQLHLLHRDADAVSASWHASARQKLGRKFGKLGRVDEDVRKKEAAVAETRNLATLKKWAGNSKRKSMEDRVQTLDEVVSGLWSLSEPGGRYARVVRQFEKWVDQMLAAVEARRKAGGLGALMESGEVAFIGELDPAWKGEVASLARKLDGWRKHLSQLKEGIPETARDKEQPMSSLVRILDGCRCQLYDMLAELDVMEEIERDAFSQEAAWIRRMNRDAADDTPGAGAIWRAF